MYDSPIILIYEGGFWRDFLNSQRIEVKYLAGSLLVKETDLLRAPAEKGVYNAPLVPSSAHWTTAVVAAEVGPEVVLVTILTLRALTAP